MIRFPAAVCLAIALAGHVCTAAAVSRIEVNALMKDSAILRIDGVQVMLRSGQRSPEGVLLVSADSRGAIVEVGGQRRELNLSQRIAATFEETAANEVKIPRDNFRQYLTSVEINGRRTIALIDTGANSVAMSSTQARSMGIDYEKGAAGQVGTAGGIMRAYSVTLDKVSVGGIVVHNVHAAVIEGDYPERVLLGITYLQHVGMREENGIMYLKQKY
jgi:aspartyl protease family protein